MCEREMAERLDREIDRLLTPDRDAGADRFTAQLRDRLAVARCLAELDLSDQSQVRESLADRLADHWAGATAHSAFVRRFPKGLGAFRRPLPATVLALGVLLVAFAVVDPRALAAAAEAVLQGVKRVVVGDHTSVEGTPGERSDEIAASVRSYREMADAGEWVAAKTDYALVGCRVPKGKDPIVKQVFSLRLAASLSLVPLLVSVHLPADLPADFRFRHALIDPCGNSVLVFGVGRDEFALFHTPVGENRTLLTISGVFTEDETGKEIGVPNDLSVEEMTLRGQRLVWVANPVDKTRGELHWEAGGVSYRLTGRALSKENAKRIFLDLEPFATDHPAAAQ